MQRSRSLLFAATMLAAIVSCFFFASSASAAPLTGSGQHLAIPNPNPGIPNYVSPTRTALAGGFTGTWASPADSDWWGTFKASGPIPTGGNSGTTDYGFSDLAHGYLPTGTFFNFGDVDYGSVNSEIFTLSAFDSGGNQITTAWLDEAIGVWGSGSGSGGAPDVLDMPGWAFDNTTGTYTFNGNTVTGFNPTVSFSLTSNVPIYQLHVVKDSTYNAFWLAAPTVPEPASFALLGLGGVMMLGRRRRTMALADSRPMR